MTYPTADYIYPSNSDFYNVKRYGARGDGSTDDSAAIRAAMADAFSDKRMGGTDATVYFPSGTYLVTDTLLWASYPSKSAHISATVNHGCITAFNVSDGGAGYASTRSGRGGLWVVGGGGTLYARSQRGRGLQIHTNLSSGSVTSVDMNGLPCVGQGFTSTPKVTALNWRAAVRFEGQNKKTSIIKLANNTFKNRNCNVSPTEDPVRESCKALFYVASNLEGNANGTGEAGYKNDIWNLTIEIGSGNPGAIGIDWQASNRASIKNVNVISDDGTGRAGISIARTAANGSGVGPALVKNVSIHGFDYGIYANADANQVGVAFEYINLHNQHVYGVLNGGMPNWFREISSTNKVPVFVNCIKGPACSRSSGSLVVIDGTFKGGDGASSAVLVQNNQPNNGVVFLRNIRTAGYKSALATGPSNAAIGGSTLAEWAWPTVGPPLLGSATTSLNLEKVPNTPEFFDNNFGTARLDSEGFSAANCSNMGPMAKRPGDWADVTCYGAARNGTGDQTKAIQSAMNSGRPVIYFPFGRYTLSGTLHIPSTVRKVIGLNSLIKSSAAPIFSCESTSGNSVEIRLFDMTFGPSPAFSNACTGAFVIANVGQNAAGYRDARSGNTVFFEDYAGPYPLTFSNSTVYARQFDIEGGYPNFTNSTGWLFGFKTESVSGCGAASNPCPTLLTASGGRIEVIGAAHYLNKNTGETRPEYSFTDTSFSVAGFNSAQGWNPTIRDTKSGVTRNYDGRGTGFSGCCVGLGLFAAHDRSH